MFMSFLQSGGGGGTLYGSTTIPTIHTWVQVLALPNAKAGILRYGNIALTAHTKSSFECSPTTAPIDNLCECFPSLPPSVVPSGSLQCCRGIGLYVARHFSRRIAGQSNNNYHLIPRHGDCWGYRLCQEEEDWRQGRVLPQPTVQRKKTVDSSPTLPTSKEIVNT